MISNAVSSDLQHGFSLIELLVAIGVFAIISVVTVTSLQNMTTTSEIISEQSEQLSSTQFTVSRFEKDLRQAIPRTIRDQLGDRLPEFEGSSQRISVTVTGWQNPTAQARASMRRVSYLWAGNQILHRAWPVLDRTQSSQPDETVLLQQVDRFQFRYMDRQNEWHREWPPSGSDEDERAWPLAVELDMDITGLGRIIRLVSLVSESNPPQAPIQLGVEP